MKILVDMNLPPKIASAVTQYTEALMCGAILTIDAKRARLRLLPLV